MLRAEPITLAKVHIILIYSHFLPLRALRATQELLVGHMRPAGRRLPTPALTHCMLVPQGLPSGWGQFIHKIL